MPATSAGMTGKVINDNVATQRHRQNDLHRGRASMLSRRGFVNGTIGAGIALATPGRAGAQTPAPARNRMIVDAQVLLWTAATPGWRWEPVHPPPLPVPFPL